VRKFDEDYYLQRFTPRRSRSRWSKVNRKKVTELIERGEMKEAGLGEVERAKADGRWDAAYDSPRRGTSRLAGSSPSSTLGTGTPSCTRSKTPRGPRRERNA
jgi:hypothetical protein